MEDLTKEKWLEFVSVNGMNSYSLIIQVAILLIWENNAITNKTSEDVIQGIGLSGAQAEMAIEYATNHNPPKELEVPIF